MTHPMFRCACDPATATLVAYVWGEPLDADFEAFRRSLHEVDQAALRVQRTPATILEVLESGQRPNAAQRQVLADTWNELNAPKQVFALVTTSAMARGVFKVVNWLNPPGARRAESVHATFVQAVHWVEKQRGESLPRFAALREQVAAMARVSPRRP